MSTLQRGTFVKIKTKDSYGLVLRYMPKISDARHRTVEVYYERRFVVFPEAYLEEVG